MGRKGKEHMGLAQRWAQPVAEDHKAQGRRDQGHKGPARMGLELGSEIGKGASKHSRSSPCSSSKSC